MEVEASHRRDVDPKLYQEPLFSNSLQVRFYGSTKGDKLPKQVPLQDTLLMLLVSVVCFCQQSLTYLEM